MAIEAAFLISLAFGFVVGIVVKNSKVGCAVLFLVPIVMMFYIHNWQLQNLEVIRSTSGLDFLFGSFWPTIAALTGFAGGLTLRLLDDGQHELNAEKEEHYGDFDYAETSVSSACSDRNIPFLESVSGYFEFDKIWLYYLTDRPINEDEREELRCISTEVISDFYGLGLEEFFVTELPKLKNDRFEVKKGDFQELDSK